MRVELSTNEGRCGDRVQIRVQPETAEPVTGVHVTVDAYGLDVPLHREGEQWVGEESVPYEAEPGVYYLQVRAYDSGWRTIESAQTTFTVRA